VGHARLLLLPEDKSQYDAGGFHAKEKNRLVFN